MFLNTPKVFAVQRQQWYFHYAYIRNKHFAILQRIRLALPKEHKHSS
jgi:hypothetical protein